MNWKYIVFFSSLVAVGAYCANYQQEQLSNLKTEISSQKKLLSQLQNELENFKAEKDKTNAKINFLNNKLASKTKNEISVNNDRFADFKLAPEQADDHLYGKPNARFSIYEFTDFDCPFCSKFFQIAKSYVESNPDLVNVRLRQFPLPMHGKSAQIKALISECAGIKSGNRAFYAISAMLYNTADTKQISKVLEISEEELLACLNSQDAIGGMLQGLGEGNALEINSTPGVVILDNDKKVKFKLNGTPTVQELNAVITAMEQEP